MTNKDYRLASLKRTLIEKRKNGQKEVIWKLNDVQLRYVSSFVNDIIPYLYEINTRTFYNPDKIENPLIKEIYHANKKGQKKIYKRLSNRDLKDLERYGVKYHCFKYQIIL